MTDSRQEQDTIRLYLLGKLAGEEREEFERRLFAEDDDFIEELLAVEEEMIDDFLSGDLSTDEAAMFEKNFLVTDERRQKVRMGKAFRTYAERASAVPPRPIPSPARWNWQQLFSSPLIRAAAFAAVLLIAAVGVWRIFFYQSDVDKALVALNNAYREQRLIEARFTNQSYAHFRETRGGELNRVDILERDRAKALLLVAVKDNRTSAVQHALGKVYLAEKAFAAAIQQFEEALKSDPNNAQIYADLGAAFLEKGKQDKTGPEPGKDQEEFARSREYLQNALELNPKLPEALFNRALVSENQLLTQQAIEDWREYLKVDPDSQWATDAREHVKRLEERKTDAAQANEKLHEDFLKAFESKNADLAWMALKASRTREGNTIVQALLDEYLGFGRSGQSQEAATTLQKLFFAGNVEQQRVGDRFTSDLTQIYRDASSQTRERLAQTRAKIKAAIELYGKNQFDQASRLFVEAKTEFTQLGDEPEALLAESWIGYNYLRIPRVEESTEIFDHLSKEFERRNYKSLWLQTFPALADFELGQNEFSKTLDLAYRGLQSSRQIEDNVIGVRCLAQTVSSHLSLGNYRQSLAAFVQAVDLADTLPYNPRLMWQVYQETALDFHFLGFTASAQAFEEEALRLAYASKAPLYISRSWEQRALLYAAQKQHEEAIKSGEQALEEGKRLPDASRTNILAHANLTLGKLYNESGNPRTALEHLDRSIELYQQLEFRAYFYEAHKGRLLALLTLRDYAAADQELRTVLNLFEEYRDKIVEEENSNRFFDVGYDTYDLAVDFAYSQMGDPNRAFEYAESSRSRMLYEMMKNGTRLISVEGHRDNAIESQTKPLTLAEIQRRMPRQTQILQYSFLNDKLIAWVIMRERIKTASVAVSGTELDLAIKDYFALMSRGASEYTAESQRTQAKHLYATLITPVQSLLDKQLQLVIAADKSLNYVPFASLISPSSGRKLIEDYPVEMTPSASVFVLSSEQAKARESRTDERLLIVGNPSFDRATYPDLEDLPGAKREAESVKEYYLSRSVLINGAARAERVKNDLKNFEVIHLATHAVADPRSPLLSKLLFSKEQGSDASSHHADRSALQASELYELQLPRTRLVVLSACQTGLERAYKGEGAIGLARPFIAAGVPIVVASLWPVESEGTAELMISFHKYRRLKGMPTVEALRQAQLEMIGNSPHGSKSNSWAGFVVIGGYANF